MDYSISATISNTPPESPASDFNFLRQEGIKYIQQLAGNTWTDHNTHDPGITILDQLCYAITDLSYRIDYDIRDLMAREDAGHYEDLFSAAQVMTVNPVTISDIRKVVIDVDGVKNAWIEKVTGPEPAIYFNPLSKTLGMSASEDSETIHLKGLYKVMIEEKDRSHILPGQGKDVAALVKARLNHCRNVCEDYYSISTLEIQEIVVSGNIEVGAVTDINLLAANILFRIANFISPIIRFYTLEELISKGKTPEEIFEGPALTHGFIDDAELNSYDRKTELHISDLIREIMDEPGVLAVNNITAGSGLAEEWRLVLEQDKAPRMDKNTLANLKFFRNGLRINADTARVTALLEEMQRAVSYPSPGTKSRNATISSSPPRNIQAYHSIQQHFPEVYGIGDTGLPASASSHRIAQARQLKAYLLIFEQLLAAYFAQVAHLKDLFSFRSDPMGTYFYQSIINSVPGAKELIKDDIPAFDTKIAHATEAPGIASERKNRFLDHLLARFNEEFVDYSLSGYEKYEDPEHLSEKLAKVKMNFLRNYPAVSNDRLKAFNYTVDSWDTDNISGLEKRIAAKIGILNYKRRFLAGKREEGFHMIEHILLRPRPEDVLISPPRPIDALEVLDNGNIHCLSVQHGLLKGEVIRVVGTGIYDGEYPVTPVSPDRFQIKTAISTSDQKDRASSSTGYWSRKEPPA